jgi:molybdate transport system regulatory protein
MSNVKLSIRFPHHDQVALGPGKVELLEKINETGSISAAAKAMHMSYKRAWDLVNTMNSSFKQPVVSTSTGGKQGGGTEVSEFGLKLIATYRHMEANALSRIQADADAIMSQLK